MIPSTGNQRIYLEEIFQESSSITKAIKKKKASSATVGSAKFHLNANLKKAKNQQISHRCIPGNEVLEPEIVLVKTPEISSPVLILSQR